MAKTKKAQEVDYDALAEAVAEQEAADEELREAKAKDMARN